MILAAIPEVLRLHELLLDLDSVSMGELYLSMVELVDIDRSTTVLSVEDHFSR